MPNASARVRTRSRKPWSAAEPVVEAVRADRRDLVRRRQVGRVHEHRAADVEDRRRGRDALAVHRDRLGSRQPELLDEDSHIVGADEIVTLVVARLDLVRGVLELEHDPRTLQRNEAGRHPRLIELVVDLLDQGGVALALLLEVLDLGAELQDAVLELVLLGLESQRGPDERLAFLARVLDARRFRSELRRHEEAERQERDPEGDLPARDPPDPLRQRGHGAPPGRRRRARMTPSPASRRATMPSPAARADWSVGGGGSTGGSATGSLVAVGSGSGAAATAVAPVVAAVPTDPEAGTDGVVGAPDDEGAAEAVPATPVPAGVGAAFSGVELQPDGSGPGGSGCGP